MRKGKIAKRSIAMLLTAAIIMSCLPVTVFADSETAEEAEIKETLLQSIDSEQYPSGMFDFLTPRMETSEDISEAEFAIVRRGNTDEAASVTFKAIDMTAKYGEDYTLEVPRMIFDKTLPENPEAQLLLYDEANTEDNSTVELIGEDAEASNETADETVGETVDETVNDEADEASGETFNETVGGENTDDTQSANIGMDLRSARTALTGAESDYTNWREADEETTEMLSEAYGEMYDELEGVEYTLEFEPGEYMKTLKFKTIDDKISEDEEQVLFVLSHPENCEISENPTGFMNIKDNEEAEEITFGFSENSVTVGADSDKAELIIERKTGLYRYGTVTVSSAEYTAAEGTYYDGFATEIAFVPGQEYKRLEIPIKTHPAVEDVLFKVYIDGTGESATVNIEHGNIIDEKVSGDDIVAEKNDVQLMSDDVQLMAANDNLWNRKETVTPKVSSNNGKYATWFVDRNCWCIPIDSCNQDSSIKLSFDLSMVGKISVKSLEFYEGTWYDNRWWFFGWHGSKGFYHDMWNYINIGDSKKVEHYHKYNATDTITLSDSDRKAGSITYGTRVSGKCHEAMGLFSKNIELIYFPIEVKIGMWDNDAMIQKKIYTSPTKYSNDGSAFLAGKLKFNGEQASTTSKFFYNNDIVSFEETDRQEKDGTYLWGIKFETKAGSTNDFFYYKGDSFSIKDLYNGKLKDEKGRVIGSTAKLSEKINGETVPCYRIYPVYKQKTAYTTIKIDSAKSQFAAGTFKNEETIKTGLLDKIQISIAGKGEWAVSGFEFGHGNRGALDQTTADIERSMDSEKLADANAIYKKYSPVYKKNSNWTKTIANAEASTPGNYLFSPLKSDNSLEALYQKPEISVAVNPKSNSKEAQEQGFVAYMDDNGSGQVAKYTGTDSDGLLKGDEIKVSPYKTGSNYQFIGGFNDPSETGYKFQWQDFTGDINRDGKLTYEEIKALGSGYDNINKGVYAGDIFNFVPNIMGSPIVYFNIVPKSQKDTGFKNTLSGNVLLQTCSVIENSKPKPSVKKQPIAEASITAGGYTVMTDENGKWEIEASEFDAGETYTATLTYGGRSYTGDATVNRAAVDFIVDEYNTFNVKSFNAYRVTNDSEYENVEDWNLHSLSNAAISNEDKRHLYTFQIDELIPTTATAGKVEVERHSSDGTLKKTYTAVYNKESDVYEIKDPTLLEKYKDNPDAYNYSFNPATENIAPGDYMTIRVYDQYGVGYIKHNIGFSYKPKLAVINIVNSFKSPLNPAIEYIGKVYSEFDLGLTANIDDVAENKLNVITTEDERTISFGWSTDFSKSYDSTKKKDEDKSGKDPESGETPKTAAESVKEEAKKLENASNESGKDSAAKKEASDKAKEAVDTKDNDNKRSSKVTADLKVDLSVALELVMGYDSKANRYYFKDLVITGIVSGEASAAFEYATPIGIVLFVKGSLGGDITAMLGIEPYYQNPAEPKYLYMDETGTIDLTKLGNSNVNRQLSIYGKLMVRPKITLTVGAHVFNEKIASVKLNGAADFDMIFTTACDGAGKVTLSADLVLEILGGLIKKKWLLANKSYDMFSINGGTLASLMSVDEDYRYDVITPEDTDDMLYLENRSGWNGNNESISLMATGTDRYNEYFLQTGAYPYANPQIFTIDRGEAYNGSDSKQILIFLDKNESSAEHETELKYSLYSEGVWSEPQSIDDDSTNVDTPNITDLGDRLFIAWSSEGSEAAAEDYDDRLNSRNLKAAFFDKASATFGEITEITQTTEFDNYADHYATAAYYEDADNKKLIVSYVKTAYDPTGEMSSGAEELTVGDVLDAYTVVAFRIYDFETGKWTQEYSQDYVEKLKEYGMADKHIEAFQSNWYGQAFVDLSQYVSVDESNLLIPEDDENLSQYTGLWSREPESSEISLTAFQKDPRIVEHKTISCGEYAVSAYVIDLDKSNETTDDRDIFLQMYDFKEDKFYPAIRLTNDAYNQSHITFADTPEGEMLYYLSDGNIVSQNMSELAENLIKTTDKEGKPVLVRNNYYPVYSGESVIFASEEDNPYTEFIVNTDDTNVYLTWTKDGISFKDGIDSNSEEATLPENYYSERQMYMAMETFDVEDYTYTDDDGTPICYPKTDESGKTVDWTVTPDINGETGKVKAGDPIVEKLYSGRWTEPVQMTDEQGAHYSDIDCVMIAGGILRCVYLKGMSEITDILDTSVPAENTDNRSLVIADFDFNVERYTLSIDNTEDIAAGREEMPIYITVKNESLLTMSDVNVVLAMTKDGESEIVGTETIDTILGGDSETEMILWNVPDELDNVTLTAYVEEGGIKYGEVLQTLDYDGLIEITDIYHEQLDRNTAEFTVSVKNSGSENAKNENVYINCGGVVSKSEEFDLVSGDTAVITVSAEIPEETFEESRDETTITETAPLRVYTNNSIEDYSITRSAPLQLEALMNKTIVLKDDASSKIYTDKITMMDGDLLLLGSSIDGEDAVNYPRLSIVSDNEDIVSVTNGVLTAEKAGTAKIEVTLYPSVDTYLTNDSDYMQSVDTYNTLPSCLFKTMTLDVNVSKSSTKHSGGGLSSIKTTPAPAPTATAEPSETTSPENHIAYISGYDDGTFKPDNSISRAETAVILARLTDGFDERASYTSSFPDVIRGAWYENYIAFEEDKGVISGYPDGTFKPEGDITRAEFAAVITKYAGLSSSDETDAPFDDTNGHWASEQINLCYSNGYISGYEDNTFKPDNYITRAEAVAIINRVLERIPDKEAVNNSIPAIHENVFTDIPQNHWGYYDVMEASITHNAEDFH